MSDEKPKRVRGQKEREAAYRQGFLDGMHYSHAEAEQQRWADTQRDAAIRSGLVQLREQPVVKRTRRKRAEPVKVIDGSLLRSGSEG